jgi:hypothetical protein
VPTPTDEAAPRRTEKPCPDRDARTEPSLMEAQRLDRGTNAEPDPKGSPCSYPHNRVEPEVPAPILTDSLMSSGWAAPIGRCSPCSWMDWKLLRRKENNRLPPTRPPVSRTWCQLRNPKRFFPLKRASALAQGPGWNKRARR